MSFPYDTRDVCRSFIPPCIDYVEPMKPEDAHPERHWFSYGRGGSITGHNFSSSWKDTETVRIGHTRVTPYVNKKGRADLHFYFEVDGKAPQRWRMRFIFRGRNPRHRDIVLKLFKNCPGDVFDLLDSYSRVAVFARRVRLGQKAENGNRRAKTELRKAYPELKKAWPEAGTDWDDLLWRLETKPERFFHDGLLADPLAMDVVRGAWPDELKAKRAAREAAEKAQRKRKYKNRGRKDRARREARRLAREAAAAAAAA